MAHNKEELLTLLASVASQFDEERLMGEDFLMGSAAEGLLMSLHHALLLRPGSKRAHYRTTLSHGQALQCTVLVTAIEMMFRNCSLEALSEHVHLFRKFLLPNDLPRLLVLLTTWEGGETIRLLAISNTIKIMRRVGPLCQEATEAIIEALLSVMRAYMGSPEIHVEAANVAAYIFDRQEEMAQRKRVIELVQKDSSLIISTLSTAAMSAATHQEAEEVLSSLFNFAVNSHAFRNKMAKRRCTVLAITKHLSSKHVDNRKIALNICKCLFNDQIQTTFEPARLDRNSELLLTKLMDSAQNESDTMLQLYTVSLLGDAVQNGNLMPELEDSILGSLRELVDSDSPDDVVVEAAAAYTKAATSLPVVCVSKEILNDITDFTTLPFAKARRDALSAIDYLVTGDDGLTEILLSETELLENFSLIISYGSDNDCTDSLNVVRYCAGNELHHPALCQSRVIQSLVDQVTKDEITNQTAFTTSVGAILELLSNNDNLRCFVPYPDLLPCLVNLANVNTSNEELKQKLVSATVRLSSAILG